MQIAMIIHPPAFGLKFKSIQNEVAVSKMKGIKAVFPLGFSMTITKKRFLIQPLSTK
jgi:hypothetical protein